MGPDVLTRLPLLTLYLTERCNSRCLTCDYWRHGKNDLTLQTVQELLPDLESLGARLIVLSGGEPLLNSEWSLIADLLRRGGARLWLLTSGLALAKHARSVAPRFEVVTVSLDGVDAETYAAIRGLHAFDKVLEGVRAAVALGVCVTLRVTLQRANYRQLPRFVALARELHVRQVSFLAVDVANPHAFGRSDDYRRDLSLNSGEVEELGGLIERLIREHAEDFASGFIAESPQKLWRIQHYFAAVQGAGAYPPVRCNAPEFSAVVGVGGKVQPCFFIDGPPQTPGLAAALNAEPMRALRAAIRRGERSECRTCVCSLWRDPATLDRDLKTPEPAAASIV